MKNEKKQQQEENSQKYIILRQKMNELQEQQRHQDLAMDAQLRLQKHVTWEEVKKTERIGKECV